MYAIATANDMDSNRIKVMTLKDRTFKVGFYVIFIKL